MNADAPTDDMLQPDGPPQRLSGAPHSASTTLSAADRHGGYNLTSVIWHGISAALVLALVASWALDRHALHAATGLIAAPIFVLHLVRRFARGFPRPADEPLVVSFAGRVTMVALLFALVAMALTGTASAFIAGNALSLFGLLPAPPPFQIPVGATDLLSSIHRTLAIIVLVALAVHVLLVGWHMISHRYAIARRIFRPIRHGR